MEGEESGLSQLQLHSPRRKGPFLMVKAHVFLTGGPPYTLVEALAPWITKKFAQGGLQSTGTPFFVSTLLVWVLQSPDTQAD